MNQKWIIDSGKSEVTVHVRLLRRCIAFILHSIGELKENFGRIGDVHKSKEHDQQSDVAMRGIKNKFHTNILFLQRSVSLRLTRKLLVVLRLQV